MKYCGAGDLCPLRHNICLSGTDLHAAIHKAPNTHGADLLYGAGVRGAIRVLGNW